MAATSLGGVYAALDRELGAEVAVQRLSAAWTAEPAARERLKQAVLLARRVSHPNVGRIHDWIAAGLAAPFLTLELLRGETLASYLHRKGGAPRPLARRWLDEIAAGLDAAHAAGVVHGCLEPACVVLAETAGAAPRAPDTRRAVITSFGLAGLAPAPAEPLVGARANRSSVAADVRAFGCLACTLLTGRPPDAVPPTLGAAWDAMVAACLASDPARRPPSAGAALALLPAARAPISWWRRRRGLRLAALAAASACALALGVLARRHFPVRSQVRPGAGILLTPLVNGTGQAKFAGAGAVLRQQLAQSGHFELLGPGQVRRTLARMEEPAAVGAAALARQPALARQVALRAGAPLVVFGGLSRLAGGYRLEVELERVGDDPDAPARRWRHTETAAAPAGVFRALRAAADWVRRRAGEPGADLAATDRLPQDITTSSWSALALYARAQRERAAGNTPASIALLHAALADDPDFALAWVRLGDEQTPEDLSAASYTDYRRALVLARREHRLSKREQLRAQGDYDYDVGDERGAAAAFAAYAALYPNDYLGWMYQAYPDVAIGAPAQAGAALERAQALRPDSAPVAANLAFVDLWVGDPRAAAAETRRIARLPGGAAYTALLRGLLDVAADNEASAVAEFAGMRASIDTYPRTLAPRLEADALAEMGQYVRAEAMLRAALVQDAAIESPSGVAELHLDLAFLQARHGRAAAVRRQCAAAIAAYASPHVLVEAGTMLARVGDVAGARQALAALAPYRGEQPAEAVDAARLQGEIRLAEGHVAGALARLRQASSLSDAFDDREYLAHALAAAGDLRPAERLYARAAVPARVWMRAQPELPGWYAHLAFQAARLAQQLGLPDARVRWEQFLQLRAHADLGLPGVRFAQQALRQPAAAAAHQ